MVNEKEIEADHWSINVGDSIDLSRMKKLPPSQQIYEVKVFGVIDNDYVEDLICNIGCDIDMVVPRKWWQLIIPISQVYKMRDAEFRIIGKSDKETKVERYLRGAHRKSGDGLGGERYHMRGGEVRTCDTNKQNITVGEHFVVYGGF